VGRFAWFELGTTDHAAAFDFYRDLFGWAALDSVDMGPGGKYQLFGAADRPVGGMYNRMAEQPGPPAWLSYVHVEDIHDATRRIGEAGGQVVVGPMEVPGGDWITVGIDPQGVMFAVHATGKGMAA
jgi:predicted enzyme related to lactoylglutathione lyase